jgi:hypothetical protein
VLESPLAPYLLWAKTRAPAPFDLAGSNMLPVRIDELPGARDAVDLTAPNDNGYPPVIEAIAAHYGVPSARVVGAAGCTGANFVTIGALVGAGDEVLVERPGYDPLVGACRLMGARVRRFERRFEDGYRLDLASLAEAVTPRTRLIIITTPHNPSGCRLTVAELRGLGELMAPRGWVLVDEVYLDAANLAAGRAATDGSAALLDGPFVVTSSLTKSHGLAGLKCGWAIASPNNAERLRRTRDLVDNASSAPADRLSAFALASLPALAARASALLRRNLDEAILFSSAHPELELAAPPESSIIFPRLRGVEDASAYVADLLIRQGVAVAPGSFFDAPAHVRISLAGSTDALREALRRFPRAAGC